MLEKPEAKNISKAQMQLEYKHVWSNGKVLYESNIDGKLYCIIKDKEGYRAILAPPRLECSIFFDVKRANLEVDCKNFDAPTQRVIHEFLQNLFSEYEIYHNKKYAINIKLNHKYNVEKLSIKNMIGYEEDLPFTWLISNFFKTLANGSNVQKFLSNFKLEKLMQKEDATHG